MRNIVCLALMALGLIGAVVSAAVLAGWWGSALVVSVVALLVGYVGGDA